MKIASIVGARPEFVQAAMVSIALRRDHEEILIHTGQHYDDLMSEIFFRELGLPVPDVNLAVGSGASSDQTGHLLGRLAERLDDIKPDLVIVRGDTNSTLAGALAARQNAYALAHIESGMRSFDASMPEETNRVIADHLADFRFVTGEDAAANLRNEGLTAHLYVTGDVMYDTYLKVERELLPGHVCSVTLPAEYDLLTIHRAGNTDDPDRLAQLISAFEHSPRPVLFPVHPRTAARLRQWNIALRGSIVAIKPLSYLDMLCAERGARAIFTDSGGVQREAYFCGVPCVTLRDETEWVETVRAGWNRLAGSYDQIRQLLNGEVPRPKERPALFGRGDAAEQVVGTLESAAGKAILERWSDVRRHRNPFITAL